MFNDLNNPTNQGQPAVDDIFAESEKNQEAATVNNAAMPAGEIDTQRTGLASGAEIAEEPADNGGGKWFKIIIIVIVAAILILSAYLVYSKFFQTPSSVDTTVNTPGTTVAPTSETKPEATATTTGDETLVPMSSSSTDGTVVSPSGSDSNTTSTSSVASSTSTEIASSSPILDSDNDGLTDLEEKAVGTNINAIDTDNDGLSDYEEVKIYHTNPLKSDTDGDGYSDGAEVKSGYNPNGAGKLGTTTKVTPAAK